MATVIRRLAKIWIAIAAGLILSLLSQFLLGRGWTTLSRRFLLEQDYIVLRCIAVIAAVFALVPLSRIGIGTPTSGAASRAADWTMAPGRPLVLALCLAGMCCAIAWGGTWLVLDGYALSRDEEIANFGAVILAHGELVARVPAAWRTYAYAVGSDFLTYTPGSVFWLPDYLPVNSALRALAGFAGVRDLVNPLLAAVSVITVFAVARRLWPGRDDLALIAAVLLATSSQVLVAGMTSYAMTAHLAFNLVWLWLFLRGGRLGHFGALVTGFLASGLHQLAFHPLFAAPFVLQLWGERRLRLAVIYTLAYTAICLFWGEFGRIAVATIPGSSYAGTRGALATGFWGQTLFVLKQFGPRGYLFMVENFIRFVTWQSLLTAPLAVLGLVLALKARGALRSLALGLVLTTLVIYIVRPDQGHGWGYRYWHGLVGSICLIAAFAWGYLTDSIEVSEKRGAGVVMAVCAMVSLLVLFPVRAWQAHTFAHPYAEAYAAIRHSHAQVVLLDPAGAWYTNDLVRNDPYLRNHPLVADVENLTDAQLSELCTKYTVDIFRPADAIAFGIMPRPNIAAEREGSYRAATLRGAACGSPPTPVGEIRPG